MTTNNHTPIVTGESNAPATINTRLSALDAAIGNRLALTTSNRNDIVAATNELRALITSSIGAVTADSEVVTARGDETVLLDRFAAIESGAFNVKSATYGATGDGTTNDTTAVTAALTAASSAGGGKVALPRGKYAVTALTVPANTIIEGQGKGSIIKITSTSGNAITLGAGAQLRNVSIEFGVDSTLRSSAERALIYVGSSNAIINGVIIDVGTSTASQTTLNKANGITIDNGAKNVIISNCILVGPDAATAGYDAVGYAGWGVKIVDTTNPGADVTIANCIIEGWNDAVKTTCDDVNLIVSGCNLNNNNRDGLDTFYSGNGKIIINGNIIHDNYDLPADMKTTGTASGLVQSDYDVIFTSNLIYNHNADGSGDGDGVVSLTGNGTVLVQNNIIRDSARGITIFGGAGAHVNNNLFANIHTYGIQVTGYRALVTVSSVSGNFANGETITDADTDSAIVVAYESGKLYVRDISGTLNGTITGGTSGATATVTTVFDEPQQPVIIAHNRIYNPGLGNDGSGASSGIRLNGCQGVIVDGNAIFWDSATKQSLTNEAAIFGGPDSDPIDCLIVNNVTNQAACVVDITTQSNNYIFGNVALGGDEDGSIRWSNTDTELQVYDGSAWQPLAMLDAVSTFTARQNIYLAANDIGLNVRGASVQSSNIFQVQSNAAATLFSVSPSGNIRAAGSLGVGGTTANTNTPSGATARQMPIYDTAGVLLGYIPIYGSAW